MVIKRWMGTTPTNRDICGIPITTYFVDGKTKGGPWGIMCHDCFEEIGCGLGLGKGQAYELQRDGGWLKIEG